MKNNVWRAHQIVESNGAYGGRSVRFMTEDGLITGFLVYAARSSEVPGQTLLQIEGDWHRVIDDTWVEVL